MPAGEGSLNRRFFERERISAEDWKQKEWQWSECVLEGGSRQVVFWYWKDLWPKVFVLTVGTVRSFLSQCILANFCLRMELFLTIITQDFLEPEIGIFWDDVCIRLKCFDKYLTSNILWKNWQYACANGNEVVSIKGKDPVNFFFFLIICLISQWLFS